MGDKVFKVKKGEGGKITVGEIYGEELEREIAIMISGEITKGSLKAASDLIRRKEEI